MIAMSPTEPNLAAPAAESLTFGWSVGHSRPERVWEATASELRRNGHTVHTPTLAGHGPGEPMTLAHADAVASLRAYLNDRGLSDVVLVGHSIGGAYIAQAAEQAPTRIKRLVFLSAFVPAVGHALADEFPPADAAFFDMTDPAQGLLLPFPVIRERACNDMDLRRAEGHPRGDVSHSGPLFHGQTRPRDVPRAGRVRRTAGQLRESNQRLRFRLVNTPRSPIRPVIGSAGPDLTDPGIPPRGAQPPRGTGQYPRLGGTRLKTTTGPNPMTDRSPGHWAVGRLETRRFRDSRADCQVPDRRRRGVSRAR
jgi:pimeloyl-ACP methyl ester carboxylesterase